MTKVPKKASQKQAGQAGVEFYAPKNKLATAIRADSGLTLQEMEQAVAKRIRVLGAKYPEKVRAYVADMRAELSKSTPFEERLENVYVVAHDLKGQSGTLGFPLVGLVGANLCAAISTVPALLKEEPDILTLHINAILWAVKNEHDQTLEEQKTVLIASLQKSIQAD